MARLGVDLREAGVKAGIYEGDEAKRIESEVVYPWLIGKLRSMMQGYDSQSLLLLALQQLESVNAARWWADKQLAFVTGFPTFSESRLPVRLEELTVLSWHIRLIVEELVALAPTGIAVPDAFAWRDTLSLAALCSASSLRSESLHLGLSNPQTTISENYEVLVQVSDDSLDIDLQSFQQTRMKRALPEPIPIASVAVPPVDTNDVNWVSIVQWMPVLRSIDQALRESLGFGLDAVIGVLHAARTWRLDEGKLVGTASAREIADQSYAMVPAIPRNEYESAVGWLSIEQGDFEDQSEVIEHWEIETRSPRIATRPFIKQLAGIYVLPWSAEMTLRILGNYISDRRLPWPESTLPDDVSNSLDRAQQQRSRELEHECRSVLEDAEFVTAARVKPEHYHKHGIASLSGEIDVIGVDPSRSLIFIIEAKDPYVPFSYRSIGRQVHQFHKSGGHVEKLVRKTGDVAASSASFASVKKISDPARKWKCVSIMVTRHVTPAAFVEKCPVAFCTIDLLAEKVMGDYW